jgi:hypothetical protein
LVDEKVKVSVNNNFKPRNTNNISNTSIQNTFVTCLNNIPNIPKLFLNTIKYLENETKNFYLKNKKYIIPATVISSYAGTCLVLKSGNDYIEKDDLWINWQPTNNYANNCNNNYTNNYFAAETDPHTSTKNPKELEELKQMDPKKLTNSLLLEIQKRHTNCKEPLDFLSPLSTFINIIEKEKIELIFYSKFYNFLKITKLLKLFPINTDNFLKIGSKLEKLFFIRDNFLSWLSMYRIEKNQALQA